jgi:hypothetical protein
MWQWLHDLSPGQATFLGWIVGIVTVVGGALLNAHLNRRRDDQLRQQDRRAVATALKAELAGIQSILLSNAEDLQKKHLESDASLLIQDTSQSVRIMPEMLDKLGLLDQETIQSVVAAHMVMEQYCERLQMLGGHLVENVTAGTRRLIALPGNKAKHVAAANTGISDAIQKAITKLDAELAKVDAS